RLACESREASLLGRKEVFMGKAKFGIFGDGKELAQIAMARVFEVGDFRAGYYRDQTFMLAIGELTLQQFFAQLYAHTDIEAEPASAGRLMNGHFGTRMLDENGMLKKLAQEKNATSDTSPTAAQMPKLVGLAYASKLFRQNPDLHQFTDLSNKGNEVAFGTIGNASTSEGLFLEAINAAGVLQIPMVISIWDDGYGISVPNEYHTTKGEISKALKGFQRDEDGEGFEQIRVNGWDYEGLRKAYKKAAEISRKEHVPVLIHVLEMTQPQGHSTSGSHERYKSKERLQWEAEYDCNKKMREWILANDLAAEETLKQIEKDAKEAAKKAKERAWKAFVQSMKEDYEQALEGIKKAAMVSPQRKKLMEIHDDLKNALNPIRLDAVRAVKKALRLMRGENHEAKEALLQWHDKAKVDNEERYSSHLYSQSPIAAIKVEEVKPEYKGAEHFVDGREVLQACFDAALKRDPKVFAFGEDVGKIGDVNQAFAGLQQKYGELRGTDTGSREVTIIGQGVGTALRGLR